MSRKVGCSRLLLIAHQVILFLLLSTKLIYISQPSSIWFSPEIASGPSGVLAKGHGFSIRSQGDGRSKSWKKLEFLGDCLKDSHSVRNPCVKLFMSKLNFLFYFNPILLLFL